MPQQKSEDTVAFALLSSVSSPSLANMYTVLHLSRVLKGLLLFIPVRFTGVSSALAASTLCPCLKPPLLSRNTKRASWPKGNFQHSPDLLSASPGHCSCSEVSRMKKCSSSTYQLVMNAPMHNNSSLGKVVTSPKIKVEMLLQFTIYLCLFCASKARRQFPMSAEAAGSELSSSVCTVFVRLHPTMP